MNMTIYSIMCLVAVAMNLWSCIANINARKRYIEKAKIFDMYLFGNTESEKDE